MILIPNTCCELQVSDLGGRVADIHDSMYLIGSYPSVWWTEAKHITTCRVEAQSYE